MIKKAMIMAAGAGTRLNPLTTNISKPMVSVANKPIMELILNHLQSFGINDVIANTHSHAEAIHNKFGDGNYPHVNFSYVYEKALSGTAGGVKKCEHFFEQGETFVVISGDALTDVNIPDIVKTHKSTGAIATMALKEIPISSVKEFGVVVIDGNSRVIGFQEKPQVDEAKSNLVNTGIYVFETDIFKYIPADTFYDFAKNVFPALMENNEIMSAHVINDYWNDIGTLNQYRLSTYDVLNGKVKVNMTYPESEHGWIAENCNLCPNIIWDGKAVIGEGTSIGNKVRFSGSSVIGNNCIIKDGAQIRNSIVWDNVLIEEDAVLDGGIIANNAKITSKSVITPGTVVAHGEIIKNLSAVN